MFKQNDILVDKQGNERKVLGVCGELVAMTIGMVIRWYLESTLIEDGWTLKQEKVDPNSFWGKNLIEESLHLKQRMQVINEYLNEQKKQEKWKPEVGEEYWYFLSDGILETDNWSGTFDDLYRLSTGNCHKSESDSLAYKARLIAWASENK